MYILLIILANLILVTAISAQTPEQINLTTVYATSLRGIYVFSETDYNHLDIALAKYYKLNLGYIINDPALKQKLINEFIEDARTKGYKIPKKVKPTNYFEPYEFILDLPIAINKYGYIIPNLENKKNTI